MKVTVRYLNILREVTKERTEIVELERDSTLQRLFTFLVRKYGNVFSHYIHSGIQHEGFPLIFLLNGKRTSFPEATQTILKNGDVLEIIPPIGGGY